MNRLYLDACEIIYLVEGMEPFHESAKKVIQQLSGDGHAKYLTSRLSLLECRVRPMRRADDATLRSYDAFFGTAGLALCDIDKDTIEIATRIRADLAIRTADAIHLATAQQYEADSFLTGDLGLRGFGKVPVTIIGAPE